MHGMQYSLKIIDTNSPRLRIITTNSSNPEICRPTERSVSCQLQLHQQMPPQNPAPVYSQHAAPDQQSLPNSSLDARELFPKLSHAAAHSSYSTLLSMTF